MRRIKRTREKTAALGGVMALFAAGCGGEKPFPDEAVCELGGYRLDDGRVFGLAPSGGDQIRYVAISGETGRVRDKGDGVWGADQEAINAGVLLRLGDCDDRSIEYRDETGKIHVGEKLDYRVTETRFAGIDGERAGRLVLPPDGQATSIVVSVHGSERWAGRTGERLQVLMPAYGIGVFAYDKRGTGASEGKYTQDFEILSADASLARKEALRLYGGVVPVGFWGGSQGGWVAPLAAATGGADFVIAAYGMAESPLAEDREEVFDGLRRAGHGEEVIAKAREVTDATGRVMASGFRDGFDELAEVKRKYKGEAWVEDIDGEFSGDFMRTPNWLIRILGRFFDVGTTWEYDPKRALEDIDAPHLWILAQQDREAPHERTLQILRTMQVDHPNLDIVVFPDTDHGIYEFEEDEGGTRTIKRFAPGYYPLIRDWILTGEPVPSGGGPIVFRGERAQANPAATSGE